MGSGGYYEDRVTKDNRYQLTQNYEKELFNYKETFKINNGFKLNTIYYTKNDLSWNRLINYLSVSFPILNTQSKITYSKLVHVNGNSPFVFDSINEVTEDELGIITNINLLPIILNIEGNYQLQSESFRSLKYTLSWVFQCWQIDFSVDTIWDEINLGVSIPLM